LKDKNLVGGGKVQVITEDTDKKSKFAESTKDFAEEDFENFEPIFDLINRVINETEKPSNNIAQS
jgi:hypothetical protein